MTPTAATPEATTKPLDATALEAPGLSATMRSTLPPPSELAKTLASGLNLSATRRQSLIAGLSGMPAGTLPERYEESKLLGKGGMGVVMLANDRDLARHVAVKRLQAEELGPDEIDRFLREAQVTAQLEHPGVLPVHDLGVDERGRFYYVMRLIRGDVTLRRVIDRLKAGEPEAHREFTFERRVKLVQDVAHILQYAHSKGVIHRDVKPENIMLGAYGEVYLVDWGLAKLANAPADGAQTPVVAIDQAATQAGSIVGTPRYMAPEQANGEAVTLRSDLYSLTAVLYELLSLEHYLGDTPTSLEKLFHKILTVEPIPAENHYSEHNGRVPRHLSLVCDRGLAKKPEDRYASALELERELQDWLEGNSPVLCPVTLQLRMLTIYRGLLQRHPIPMAMVTVFLPALALLGFVGYRIYLALR